ncbi:DUF4445 domain-containing protein [Planctomycetota bacterium]|nr:DUF4445 domain-containing protein [Planctomycetota bacterium]
MIKIAVITCAVLETEIEHYASKYAQVMHIEKLEQGLHNEPPRLRVALQQAITRIEQSIDIDAIVLGYGLCSRGIEGITTSKAKLVIPRAHDCITLLLGSKEKYAQYVADHPGTYWYSPGWNRHHLPPGPERHKKLYDQYVRKYGEDNADYLMQSEQHWFSTYDRATYVHLTVGVSDQDKSFTQNCSNWLGWNYDEQAGDSGLLESLLSGHWDSERFLVLQPGQTAVMTSDESILQKSQSLPVLRIQTPTDEHHITLTSQDEVSQQISTILRKHGFPLNTRCGERSICDGCLIELTQGQLHKKSTDQSITAKNEPITLKACEYQIDFSTCDNVSIRIPSHSTSTFEPSVLNNYRINIPFAHQPIFDFTATNHYALAVDIGTTTVAMMLIDLNDGKVVSKASSFNNQMHLGDDVLTRINLCMTDLTMLKQLQNALVSKTFKPLIDELLSNTNLKLTNIAGMVIAGNTTMLHLCAGIDPSTMGMIPFTPQFLSHKKLNWADIGLDWPDSQTSPSIHLLPSASAYIGADIVGGALATGMHYESDAVLLVDVGTNGEIVLQHKNQLLACATAAGPAFEGAGLKSGMRAGDGAVSHLNFQLDPFKINFNVIGNCQPIGLCGSAYIDLLASGKNTKIIDKNGHYTTEQYAKLANRLNKEDGCSATLHLGHDLLVSEAEIAKLLQAKAAIAAGIITLLEKANLQPKDISKLYLAGGFGMHIDLQNAIDSGLLPDFTTQQIELVGNTSLASAYMTTLDRDLLQDLANIANNMNVIELNAEASFQNHFIDQLTLA